MKYNIITTVIFFHSLLLPAIAQSEKPVIKFSETEHDFGTIRESDGSRRYGFAFTNNGKTPLIVSNVKATCGCTATEWTREPVLPGKSGVIHVVFDPRKQSGAFRKSVVVTSNSADSPTPVYVKGVVIPTESFDDVYKFTTGPIRLDNIYVAFGEVFKGNSVTRQIKVYNSSTDQPAVVSFRQVPPHMTVRIVPEKLEPLQEGVIEIQYLSGQLKDWDYVVNRLELLVNGIAPQANRITVTANVREDFSALTAEELLHSPRVSIDSATHDFGLISDQQVVKHTFLLKNTGKSDLLIRKVSASCGCTAVQPAKTLVPPGSSSSIQTVFNPAGREGNQKKAITVITNDPRQSKIILWVKGTVQPVANR